MRGQGVQRWHSVQWDVTENFSMRRARHEDGMAFWRLVQLKPSPRQTPYVTLLGRPPSETSAIIYKSFSPLCFMERVERAHLPSQILLCSSQTGSGEVVGMLTTLCHRGRR